jgi:hypothetical protein
MVWEHIMLEWNILHNAVSKISMPVIFWLADIFTDCGTAIASTGAVASISDCSMACLPTPQKPAVDQIA